jgi:hypothetical protein
MLLSIRHYEALILSLGIFHILKKVNLKFIDSHFNFSDTYFDIFPLFEE